MGWEIDTVSAVNSGEMGAGTGDVPSTDQRAKRAYAYYKDQHDRPWGATIENKTGDPCGPLEAQFQAPFRAHDKFITINSRQRKLFIRYEEMIREVEEANADWNKSLRDNALRLYGDAAPEAIKNPPPELLNVTGPRPALRREPIEAAMTGNKWILGLSPVKPEWAKEFYPDEPVNRVAAKVEVSRQYPDADDEHEESPPLLKWGGPKVGWILPNGTKVPREEDETAEEHKDRALLMMEG